MAMPAPAPGLLAPLTSAAGFSIRPLVAEDAGPLVTFGGAPGTHYLCFGSDAYAREPREARDAAAPEQTIVALVATGRDGGIVGMARLVAVPGSPGSAELTVAVQGAYERLGLLAPLLSAIAAEARSRGITQLTTSLECHRCNPMEDFRGAGLRVESWFGSGGITELVLAIE